MITIIRSLDESQLDLVISLTAFVSAFLVVSYMLKFVRLRKASAPSKDNDVVIGSVLSQFARKVDNLSTSVQDLRTRVDLLEAKIGTFESIRMNSSQINEKSSLDETDARRYMESPSWSNVVMSAEGHKERDITSLRKIRYDNSSAYRDTITHVLSLLLKSPKTARQIQQDIHRSREHTSRLVRKLADEGLVRRNETIKPFSYSITDEGRKLLV
jgi:hypothetical protein